MKENPTTTYGFELMAIGEQKQIQRTAAKIRPMISYYHKKYPHLRFTTKSLTAENACIVTRVS